MADIFSEALEHHRAGRLLEAGEIYRAILAQHPDHADSLNLLGVVAHQQGNDAQAITLAQQALRLRPDDAKYHVNLAAALRGLHRFEEAIESCQTALRLNPDQLEARLNLGMAFHGAKRWAEADEQFRRVAEDRPGDSRGPQLLGDCLHAQNRVDEAVAAYREALKRNPNDAAANLSLGTILLTAEHAGLAEPFLQRAAALIPNSVPALQNLASCLVQLGRERDAVSLYEQALRLAPDGLDLAVSLGHAWLACGERTAAEDWFKRVLALNPKHSAAISGLADVRQESGCPEESVPLYEQALQIDPMSNAYKGLSDALWELGDVDQALQVLRTAVVHHADKPECRVRLGKMLVSAGELEEGKSEFHEALRLLPGYLQAVTELANVLGAKVSDEDRAILDQAVELRVPALERAAMHFALFKVYDGRKEYARAAEHAHRGNELNKAYYDARKQGYDAAHYHQFAEQIIEFFTPELFVRTQGFGRFDERPVFVVGMPRSGTTLVEQILASHPRVFGVGERRFAGHTLTRLPETLGLGLDPKLCFERLSSDAVQRSADWHLQQLHRLDGGRAARVVDKMPDNYALLGWLAILFPKARFIHCRRDLRDVALSCWTTSFHKIRWSNDLEQIAGRIREYRRIMAHWKKVLPRPVLEVEYERLVANQEAESRKLIDWLLLEWDPACLTFYKTQRAVQSASVTQVRQPMYTRSVGRWKNYAAALRPLLESLAANADG